MVHQASAQGMFFDRQMIEARGYWVKQLSQDIAASHLRLDYPRPADFAAETGVVAVNITGEVHQKLLHLIGDGSFLLYTTLMATLKVCLHKYTQSATIVVGSPARRPAEAETTLENALPIIDEVQGSFSFRQLLLNVRQTLLDAYERQRYPFDRLVQDLGRDHITNKCPLFDVALMLTDIHSALPVLKNDLTLVFARQPHQVSGHILYNKTLFKPATVERFASHLLTLLNDSLTDTTKFVSQLQMLTPAEQHQMLSEWNQTQTDYVPDQCIPQLLETQAAQTPDALAVACGGACLTYAALNTRANQLAHYLRAVGVGPETLVGICMERSLAMIIGLSGILKAGGAYVPLDPLYPPERLAFMMADGPVSVLLTQSHLVAPLATHQALVICLDTEWERIAQMPTDNPACNVSAENLAYVIYTSGSTGTPKGVLISHAGLRNLVGWHHHTFAVTAYDRATQLAGTAFDASVWEIWPYLTAGASLHLIDNQVLDTVEQMQNWLVAHQITITFLPTPLAERMLPLDWPPALSLRLMLIGGDTLHKCPTRSLPFKLINNYGPTENSVVTTSGPVIDHAGAAPPIGRPIAHVQVYIVDRDLQPVPVGVPGHLHISGAGLARGYLQQPQLTAEQFVPNPFGAGRLYKTGDLACYLPDGNIEFLGRLDHQVKIRGFRIELGEIEAVLLAHPDVRATVVLAREVQAANALPNEKQLVAYMVLDGASEPDTRDQRSPATWRTFLQRKLPDYMVPSVFVPLATLPLTAHGKVDRQALPSPASAQRDLASAYRPPRTATEVHLAALWAEVLGVPRVGLDDNFFALGGHSLLATQVVSRLRQTWGIEVPLRTLFEAPTVAALSAAVLPLHQAAALAGTPPLVPADRAMPLPLSSAQERLWFLAHLEDDVSPYNIPLALRMRGALDVAALEESLCALVLRHESLRTTFAPGVDGGAPVQVIGEARVALPVLDLTGLAPVAQDAEVRRLGAAAAQQHFDMTTGPLLRASVVRLQPGGKPAAREAEHVVLLTLHHMVADGWSLAVLLREWAALYSAARQGQEAALPALPLQYADYAVWQRQWLQGEALAASLAYWRRQLAGAPPVLTLPIARPRPAVQSYRGQQWRFTLPPAVAAGVRQVSQASGGTVFMTLLAAFQVLLQRYSGQDEVLVGTPIANRTRVELEPLIGLLVNTLVLRTHLGGNPPFRAVLEQVQAMTLEAYQHQEVPFEQVVDAVQPQRTLSHTPLVQVMFVLQNAPLTLGTWPELTLELLEPEYPIAKFDLALVMEEDRQGLRGTWEYSSDLFEAASIARLSGHFVRLLEAIVQDPEQPIQTLPLLTAAERQQRQEWSTRAVVYPAVAGLHELVEAQVERTAEAVAVVYGEHHLTYATLNRRANHLASQLQTLGVRPEVKVAMCLERSPEMIISFLAILKAGGCYVPLDPAYPQERLAFMLQDTRAPILLTREHLARRFDQPDMHIVCLGANTVGQRDTLVAEVRPEHLAYIIYTSGSTGEPKGVLVAHRGLCNFALALRDFFRAQPGDRVLQFFSTNFDGSISDMVLALTSGATLCMADQDTLMLGDALTQLLREEAITIARFPPAVLNALPSTDFPALRFVGSAGEACTGTLVKRWSQGRRFSNGYGPSEGTIGTCIKDCTDITDERPPIGTPFPNIRVYLLDPHLQPVPIGIPGELYVSGINLARGYLNQPTLTAEKFIPNPFNPEPGARLYRTGDLARYLPDGDIAFLGRVDNQIKLRGFRIELGEIQTLLHQHPSVQDAVVVTREDQPDHKRLVAYIVLKGQESGARSQEWHATDSDGPSLLADLRAHLKQKLPDYMLPAAFVILDTLPLSANGKVDSQALPVPDRAEFVASVDFVLPRTPTEAVLTSIWAETLGLQQVGIHDNFFELGGHSLLAIQLVSKMSVALQLDISVKHLFLHPTVATLAEVLGESASLQPAASPSGRDSETSAVTSVEVSLLPQPSPFVQFEPRPLLSLFATERIPPVEAVVLGYVSSALLVQAGIRREAFMHQWFGHLPLPNLVLETPWGRIAALILPWLDTELYSDRHGLVGSIVDALHMARRVGARTVTLAGLLPSATDYGHAVTEAMANRHDLPRISTGHATTTSTVVLAIKSSLHASGRELATERVGFIGLGSIGASTLRLMLQCLPHPQDIMLCDMYGKRDFLALLQREIVEEYDFRGKVHVVTSTMGVPAAMYNATLIIGATNAPDVLDILRVQPGTIIVDDSAPHCFNPALAVQRFQEQADILFTEGGVLRSPQPLSQLLYWHPEWARVMQPVRGKADVAPNPFEITGCVLSGLLSSRFEDLQPTIGMVEAQSCLQHYAALGKLGLQAAALHCQDYVLPEESIRDFRDRFAKK